MLFPAELALTHETRRMRFTPPSMQALVCQPESRPVRGTLPRHEGRGGWAIGGLAVGDRCGEYNHPEECHNKHKQLRRRGQQVAVELKLYLVVEDGALPTGLAWMKYPPGLVPVMEISPREPTSSDSDQRCTPNLLVGCKGLFR
jgi:hypothetical protein